MPREEIGGSSAALTLQLQVVWINIINSRHFRQIPDPVEFLLEWHQLYFLFCPFVTYFYLPINCGNYTFPHVSSHRLCLPLVTIQNGAKMTDKGRLIVGGFKQGLLCNKEI